MENSEVRVGSKKDEKNLFLKIISLSLRIPLLLIILIIILTFLGSSFFLSRYPNSLSFMGINLNEELRQQKENEELLVEVGGLMSLPEDEQPTIATVTDVESVADQPFFKDARNGDKVLIYRNAQKAILYRPEEKRIIEVGAVNVNNEQEVQLTEDTESNGEVVGEEDSTDEVTPTVTEPTPTSETVFVSTPTPTSEEEPGE